jgi:hypothetical protein
MNDKSQEVINNWINYIKDHNIEKLINLYDKSAIIIPTFSDSILNTPEKIRNYFEKLLQRKELQIAMHNKTIHQQFIDKDIVIISGIYYWKFIVEEELMTYEARFTFVMNLSKTSPIIHHHSSQLPRMI